jgi:hypothetical protein
MEIELFHSVIRKVGYIFFTKVTLQAFVPPDVTGFALAQVSEQCLLGLLMAAIIKLKEQILYGKEKSRCILGHL